MYTRTSTEQSPNGRLKSLRQSLSGPRLTPSNENLSAIAMDSGLHKWVKSQLADCYKKHPKDKTWPESYYLVRTIRAHRSNAHFRFSLCFRFLAGSAGWFQLHELRNYWWATSPTQALWIFTFWHFPSKQPSTHHTAGGRMRSINSHWNTVIISVPSKRKSVWAPHSPSMQRTTIVSITLFN